MVSDPDLTARAVIRDEALALFAERGPDAVTIRDIAAAANVSPGLVLHHYGSKQGLRDAVDAHVETIFEAVVSGLLGDADEGASASLANAASFAEVLVDHLPPGSPVPAYIRRLLLSGDPAGRELFRRWYELTLALCEQATAAGLMRPSADPEVRAAFLMVNDLATMLLHKNLAAVVGVDPLTPDGITRWTADALDAYTNGVFRLEKP